MKKLLCAALAILTLALSACSTAPTPTTPVATTPAPTTPIVTTPQITTPAVTTPVGTEPLTTPMETAPVVTPICTTPAVTTPIVTTPQSTMPISTSPIETTPIATTPIMTAPIETTPTVTTPVETLPVIYSTYQLPDKLEFTEVEKEIVVQTIAKSGITVRAWYGDHAPQGESRSYASSRHEGLRYYGHIDDYYLYAIPVDEPDADGSYPLSALALYAYRDYQTYAKITSENCTEDVYEQIEEYHAIFEAESIKDGVENDPFWYGGQNLPLLDESPYSDEELIDYLAETYLGTYNGWSVYFRKGQIRGTSCECVGGVSFWMGEYYTFAAYKDGEWEGFAELYESGDLTHDDLRAIAYYMYGSVLPGDPYNQNPKVHLKASAYPPVYPPNLMTVPDLVEELSEDKIQKFENAWLEEYGYKAQWFDKNNIVTRHFGLRYYGTHEGYMVFYRPNSQGGRPQDWENGRCKWLIEDKYNLLHGLYYYKDGEIETRFSYPVSDEAFSVITQIHKTIETEIQSREDLDDPLSHDGAWYPPIDRLDGCGTYHGYRVDGYTTMLRPYGFLIVGGSALYIGGPDFFTVSGNGIEPMSIEEAFYRGYLTVDDIKAVAYYYYGDGDPYID